MRLQIGWVGEMGGWEDGGDGGRAGWLYLSLNGFIRLPGHLDTHQLSFWFAGYLQTWGGMAYSSVEYPIFNFICAVQNCTRTYSAHNTGTTHNTHCTYTVHTVHT